MIDADILTAVISMTEYKYDTTEPTREVDMAAIGQMINMIIIETINGMPTVDADPVRHGTWIECKAKNIITGEVRLVRKCSECGSGYFIYDFLNSVDEIPNYCPNCGAKMDGERKEE